MSEERFRQINVAALYVAVAAFVVVSGLMVWALVA